MERPEDPEILPRDKALRDSFTPAELMTFISILVCSTVTFWAADPRSYWILGCFIIAGGFTLFILKTHEWHHPFFVDMLWPRFWLLAAPAIWLLGLYLVGLRQQPLTSITFEKREYLTLEAINPWMPATAAPGEGAIVLCGLGAVYVFSLCLFLIPKSRHFFERLMPLLCLNAVLVGVFGLFQKAIDVEKPVLTFGTGRRDFFAFFPYDGHWAAFAILWSSACVAMALLETRYADRRAFIHSPGPWYLTGALLLGASALAIEAKWPAIFLLLTLSLLLLVTLTEFARNRDDPNRKAITALCGIGSIAFFAAALVRLFQASLDAERFHALRRAAVEMFRDSPLFGWGAEGFAALAPFYADDRLLGELYDRAGSDLLQLAAEFGLAGLLPSFFVLCYLLVRYLVKGARFRLSNHLLTGCAMLVLLALVDSPFMSPAVFLSFFVLFFSALRWADLSRVKVDEVDARPNLIAHPSERRVPFVSKPEKDVFK